MKSEVIFILAICSLANLFVACEEIVELDDVEPSLEAELDQLKPEYVKLNKALVQELDGEIDNKKCIKVAKELLKDASPGCFGSCSSPKNNWTKALKLFLAIEGSAKKCDTSSYEILMKNYLITERLAEQDEDVSRVRYALDMYRYVHFVQCHEVHKHRFLARIERVPKGVVKKLTNAFRSLDVPRLIAAGSQEQFYGADYKDLVGMPLPMFSQSEEGQRELARKVLSQATKDLHASLIGSQTGARLAPQALKLVLDDYLFEPCRAYRKEMSGILNEARFEATYNHDPKAQADFIRGDETFNKALIFNRLCGSLLKEQDALYEPLARAWSEVLDE